jgi:hypothetical protein
MLLEADGSGSVTERHLLSRAADGYQFLECRPREQVRRGERASGKRRACSAFDEWPQ